MKVLYKNLKTSEIKLLMESMDDLWHLFNIIEKKDMVYATTQRREERKTDKLRPERGKKRTMRLGVEVEDIEFHEFSDRLRVHGIIKEGPQDLGSYHTFNFTEGDRVNIVKETWQGHHLKRIDEAVAATKQPMVLFLTMDYDEAEFAFLRQSGVQQVARLTSQGTGKRYKKSDGHKKKFYQEVLAILEGLMSSATPLIILGPGFAKEEFMNFGKSLKPDLFSNCALQGTGQGGMAGVHEALKEGIAPKILSNTRVAFETTVVEELLSEISKEGNYAYGHKEVENAILAGAVKTLLVTDKLVRGKKVDELLKKASEKKSEVVIINALHDSGKKLEALGGLGAVLRYRIN
ncbi:MAG: mRNA surveillance protein pelota [Methanomassiliicoccales archaeon]|nr:MAG: mRNA surveillance protein pelota [Methanomassiliicoccales archaeon]